MRFSARAGRPRLVMAAAWFLALALLAACAPAAAPSSPTPPAPVAVTITADGQTHHVNLPANLTVREALAQAGLNVSELDKLKPSAFTRVVSGTLIAVTRVTEAFETEQARLPFASQIVKTETLATGERRLLQAGANGAEEITRRTVFEDGTQVAQAVVKRVVLLAPRPEIVLVGSQASFTIIPISGTLAYLNGQNAWVMRGNSSQRRPLTFSSDLDGRVFDLSADGQWLLFTRAATDTTGQAFNSLWAISTTASLTASQPLSLGVKNVLYAEWAPDQVNAFAYSTAEKINRPPGWQANNNLWLKRWADQINPRTRKPERVFTETQWLDTSAGGVYGWWGTGFAFSPDGQTMAYARTDSIGLIDLTTLARTELTHFEAYNSHSDWAWRPNLTWSPAGDLLFTVTHGQPLGLEAPEDSPAFNLTALSPAGLNVDLIPRAGMFANPLAGPDDGQGFQVAFLQASDPNNSPFSRYRLSLMDRDGSNLRAIFPPADQPGLAANASLAWSPDGRLLAVIYEGNLWLVEPDTGVTQQLTGDGLSDRPAWEQE